MAKKNKPMRVKLVANPGAGDPKLAASRREQVARYLQEHGMEVDVALAKPKRKAIPIVRQAVKDKYDAVIAMGGDGTLWAVISGLAGSKTKLGIIPAGTSNDIAASLGIPEDMEEACALIASGQTRKLDLGRVKVKNEDPFYFMMVTTIGLVSTVYPMVAEVPEGKLAGIKDAVSALLKFESKPTVTLELDDESHVKVETMLVTITNTPLIGLRNLVAPDASMDDGLLDIAVYPGFNKAQLLAYFARTANQSEVADGAIQRYRACKIVVKSTPKLDVAAEGEPLGKGKARIKVLPGVLRVFAPPAGTGAEKPREETEAALPAPLSPVAG